MERVRRYFSKQEKLKLLQIHKEGTSISELSRLHGINPVTMYQWKRRMSKEEEELDPRELLRELNKLKSQNNQLKKVIGDLTLDNSCLKDLNEFLKKKHREHQLSKQKSSSKNVTDTKKSK